MVVETEGNAFSNFNMSGYAVIQGFVLKSGVTGLGDYNYLSALTNLTHVDLPDTMSSLPGNLGTSLTDIAIRYTGEEYTDSSYLSGADNITYYVAEPTNEENSVVKAIKARYDNQTKKTYTLKSLDDYAKMKEATLTISLKPETKIYAGEKVPYTINQNTTGLEEDKLQGILLSSYGYAQNDDDGNPLTMPVSTGEYQFYVKASSTDSTFGTKSNTISITAESGITYELTDLPREEEEEAVTKKKLTIKPIEGKETAVMPEYTSTASNRAPWYADRNDIYEVEIAEGVSNIGAYALRGLAKVETVTWQMKGTGSIGSNAFNGCTSLKSIDTILTKAETIGKNAFQGCTALTEVTIPENVKKLGDQTFQNCTALQTVTVKDADTRWIKIESGTKAETIELSNSPFQGCTALKTVVLPEGYKEIPNNFLKNITSIESFDIPDSVTVIGYYAFNGCTNLADLEMPEKLEKLSSTALQGTAITKLTLPESLKVVTTDQKNETSAENFSLTGQNSKASYPALQELTVNTDIPVVAGYGAVYSDIGVSTLEKVTIGEKVTTIPDQAYYGCAALTTVVFPEEGNSSLTTIGVKAFSQYSNTPMNLEGDIIQPSTVTTIGEAAFGGTKLKSVTMEAPAETDETENYYTIGNGAFGNIDTLESIELKSPAILRTGIAGRINQIGGRSKNKTEDMPGITVRIHAVDLQNTDGGEYNGSILNAFSNASYDTVIFTKEAAYETQTAIFRKSISTQRPLVKLEMEGERVTEDGYKYIVVETEDEKANWPITITGYTGEEKELTIPGEIEVNYGETGVGSEEKINHKVTAIGASSFMRTDITKVTLSENMTTIGTQAFQSCSALSDINLGKVQHIGNQAFAGANLQDMDFSSLVTVGENAFADALGSSGRNRGNINLPDTVTSIGSRAFSGISVKEGQDYVIVRLPENEAYTTIADYAFAGVKARKITIPANITEIGTGAFSEDSVTALDVKGENIQSVPSGLCSYVYIKNKESDSYKAFKAAGYTIISSEEDAKTELENKIKEAEDALAAIVRSDYQESYLAALEKRIEDAKAVLEKENAEPEDYLETAKKLATATTNSFRKTSTEEAKGNLESLMTDMEANNDPSDYTEESWNKLLEVMDEVSAYLEAGDYLNSELEALIEKLQAAADALEKKTAPPTPGPGEQTGTGTGTGTGKPGTGTGTGVNKTPDTQKVTVKKVTVKKVSSPKKKTLKIQWKKVSDATGYQIMIGTNKKMTKNKKVINIKKAKTVKKTIKKLKSKKKYFIKVRAYKTVNSKKYYGAWSKVKKIKVK